MKRVKCCWGGHLFASNVGVLPTVADGRVGDAGVVLSLPRNQLFGCKHKRQHLKEALLHCCAPNETNDVRPTVDSRSPRR